MLKPKPLSAAEQSGLMRVVSDLESGDARQWYWLEIAQALPPASKTRRAKLMGIACKAFGINACSPILAKYQLGGIALYQTAATRYSQFVRDKCNDALLYFGCMLALLLGFDRLPATLQFAAWCLGLGGAVWQIWRCKQSETIPIDGDDDNLPGAESSLGLPSILLAAGVKADVSLALVKGLKQDPSAFLAPLLHNLPSLAPNPEPSLRQKIIAATLPWLGNALLATWLLGKLPLYWACGGYFALVALLAWHTQANRKAWGVMLATWATMFVIAKIVHTV